MKVSTRILSSFTPSPTPTPFPILRSVDQVRQWRLQQLLQGNDVGFVPTMGALHNGHISLVKSSLSQNPSTILSIFVNPAQFAPHEDLSTYPRTLEADLDLLSSLDTKISALFLPPVEALYPSGITTEVAKQRGTFVEVKGLQDGMEGRSRPGFFRGVATVVLKLFNIVEPTRAYFGQKDIQQALLLRRMSTDLHLSHPLPQNLYIQPTYRDPLTHLALSSRNAYLSPQEKKISTVVIDALRASEKVWLDQRGKGDGKVTVGDVLDAARVSVESVARKAKEEEGVEVKLMYFALNDPVELGDLEGVVEVGKGAVLSGAVMLGRTRLIDNLVFDFELNP